jgi:hypothetical protein
MSIGPDDKVRGGYRFKTYSNHKLHRSHSVVFERRIDIFIAGHTNDFPPTLALSDNVLVVSRCEGHTFCLSSLLMIVLEKSTINLRTELNEQYVSLIKQTHGIERAGALSDFKVL